VNNIKKSSVSRGENISKKTGQKSSKYGEFIKKTLFLRLVKSPAEGYPSHPPPHRIENLRSLHVERT
jgi:hypothetical protein